MYVRMYVCMCAWCLKDFCLFLPSFSQLNHIQNLLEELLWTNW